MWLGLSVLNPKPPIDPSGAWGFIWMADVDRFLFGLAVASFVRDPVSPGLARAGAGCYPSMEVCALQAATS